MPWSPPRSPIATSTAILTSPPARWARSILPSPTRRNTASIASRLDSEEGFTLIELMLALGVILVAVIILAYTVSSSLANVAYSRQRDGANALANQTMEQLRALPFATIQAGLDNT